MAQDVLVETLSRALEEGASPRTLTSSNGKRADEVKYDIVRH